MVLDRTENAARVGRGAPKWRRAAQTLGFGVFRFNRCKRLCAGVLGTLLVGLLSASVVNSQIRPDPDWGYVRALRGAEPGPPAELSAQDSAGLFELSIGPLYGRVGDVINGAVWVVIGKNLLEFSPQGILLVRETNQPAGRSGPVYFASNTPLQSRDRRAYRRARAVEIINDGRSSFPEHTRT